MRYFVTFDGAKQFAGVVCCAAMMCASYPGSLLAQENCDAKCLADNTVTYGTAGGTAYAFQIQPVQSIPSGYGFQHDRARSKQSVTSGAVA